MKIRRCYFVNQRGIFAVGSSIRGLMAFSKLHFSAVSCYSYGSRRYGSGCGRFQKEGFVESGTPPSLNCSIVSRLRSALDGNVGIFRRPDGESARTHAIAPLSLLFHDSRVILEDENGGNLAAGLGEPLRFPRYYKCEKMVVAVDIDEVLGRFLCALNEFIAHHYASDHEVSEYYVYEFFRIWKCTRLEADRRVHEFFKTPYFRLGIDPIPGAQTVLRNISSFCDLSVVTSRQNVIKDHTLEWIEKHYTGLFKEIQFGNHFALDGKSRSKSEICRSLGAQVLIDDNPRYALECAEVGIKVLLFDYHNSYPWCKDGFVGSHSLVTKVYSWEEVEQQLMSWAGVLE